MSRKRNNVIPHLSTRVTATVSVALVLLLAGMAAFVGVAARSLTDAVRETNGFILILDDEVTASQTDRLRTRLESMPQVAKVTFRSAETVLERWQQIVDEDIEAFAGINPFAPEFEVNVKAGYACADSLRIITAPLESLPEVDEIRVQTDTAREVETTLGSVEMILIIIAGVLLIISFALISNTVRLTVYSRRFAIHTMKLVGATPGFIRKPFLTSNIVNGALAGLMADILLIALLFYFRTIDPRLEELVNPVATAIIFIATIVTGVIICLIAAAYSTNKYLRKTYDEMFS